MLELLPNASGGGKTVSSAVNMCLFVARVVLDLLRLMTEAVLTAFRPLEDSDSELLSSVEVVGRDEFEPLSEPPELTPELETRPEFVTTLAWGGLSLMFRFKKLPLVKTLWR